MAIILWKTMMIKNLPILLFLQAVLSFQPLQKNGRPRTSVYQSTPSIEAPCWNVTTLGRNLFQGIFDQQHTSVESRNGAFSNEKHRNANSFESAEVLNNLRSKSTIDLKLLCSKRSIRYAGLVEKEEFVQAIVNNMKELQDFSHSGQLYPGSVNEISSDILDKELDSDVPILLDVYATFCGPCKLVVPEFEAAARKLGKNCRVAKVDSQKYQNVASRFTVKGLPTTLLIHKGEVISRREGTVTRQQLLDFADPFVQKQYW